MVIISDNPLLAAPISSATYLQKILEAASENDIMVLYKKQDAHVVMSTLFVVSGVFPA